MGERFLLELSQCADRRIAGGKGYNLHRLEAAGFPVPKTLCLTTPAYEQFLEFNSLVPSQFYGARDGQAVSTGTESASIRRALLSGSMPEGIVEECRDAALFESPGALWAVRSSSNLEDLEQHTFAGLYESILEVDTFEGLLLAIRRCWSSLWSERAVSYRTRQGLGREDAGMAVILQTMVHADRSGVIFTRSPAPGRGDCLLIEYCDGSAEGLVSGRINPSRCTVDRKQLEIREETGTTDRAFPHPDVHRLIVLALGIEKEFGAAQDIEWAQTGTEFHILQSRPIAPASVSAALSVESVWTRANIGEVLPQAVTPLTWDVFRSTLSGGADAQSCASYDERDHGNGLRLHRGRVYIRLSSFLDTFSYLPWVSETTLASVLGVHVPRTEKPYIRPRGLNVRLAQALFIADLSGLLPRIAGLARSLPPLPPADPDRIDDIIRWITDCFFVHLRATAYTVGAYGIITHLLENVRPDEARETLSSVLRATGDVQTAVQGLELKQLAGKAMKRPAVKTALEESRDWPELVRRLSSIWEGPPFLAELHRFLERHGDRGAGEFELATPRWCEDPGFILGVLRTHLDAAKSTPPPPEPPVSDIHQRAKINDLLAGSGLLRRLIIEKCLRAYGINSAFRENIKYSLIQGFSLLRRIFLNIGRQFENRGFLDRTDDVFFLRLNEVRAASREPDHPGWDGATLLERRRRYLSNLELQAPEILSDHGEPFDLKPLSGLNGIGCSGGMASGPARVLNDIGESGTLEPGDILVTRHTDPGWTPLFLGCSGLVTETGGFLSHGATIAREYGLPAVVGVRGATERIRTGDLIHVDGTGGIVTIQNKGNGS